MKYQGLREELRVTVWKEGCVYRTSHVGYAWVTFDYVNKDVNTIFSSLPTELSMRLGSAGTIRRVSDDTPNIVVTKL